MSGGANERLFERARKVIPGGVNSPVRAFRAVEAGPMFAARGAGSRLYDADGREFVDYCMSWGPLILGHANDVVVEAIRKTVSAGTSFGLSTRLEVELAEELAAAQGVGEKVRLVSSGTEAAMTAVRLARGVTGRDKIIKFAGCYHGHADHLLVKAGSGAATLGIPGSAGVPADFAKHTITVAYNDAAGVRRAFEEYAGEIAAVIVEPVAGNMGVVPAKEGFLAGLRQLCDEHGSVLIFDEVITGFRLCWGTAGSVFAVEPDLTCLGKIIGGGLPTGAVAGRGELMDELAPDGPVYQAGTLSGNPVCAAAGLATLRVLRVSRPYEKLERNTAELCEGLSQALAEAGVAHTINRVGSMFTVFFGGGDVGDFESASQCDAARYGAFFRAMLKAGVYFPPSQFEACFVSSEHTAEDFEKTVAAVSKM